MENQSDSAATRIEDVGVFAGARRATDAELAATRPNPYGVGAYYPAASGGVPLSLTDGLSLLAIDYADLPATGEELRQATLDAGYDGLRVENAPDGDRVVVYRAVVEHGELGPVLVDPSHEFTGPDDVR